MAGWQWVCCWRSRSESRHHLCTSRIASVECGFLNCYFRRLKNFHLLHLAKIPVKMEMHYLIKRSSHICVFHLFVINLCQVEDIERFVDTPLRVVFLKQLNLLRNIELKKFRTKIAGASDEAVDPSILLQVSYYVCTVIHFNAEPRRLKILGS